MFKTQENKPTPLYVSSLFHSWIPLWQSDCLYVTDQQGKTIVFAPNPERFKRLAVNPLNEPSNSTPAITGGQIFIRTIEAVYCIGEEQVGRVKTLSMGPWDHRP